MAITLAITADPIADCVKVKMINRIIMYTNVANTPKNKYLKTSLDIIFLIRLLYQNLNICAILLNVVKITVMLENMI